MGAYRALHHCTVLGEKSEAITETIAIVTITVVGEVSAATATSLAQHRCAEHQDNHDNQVNKGAHLKNQMKFNENTQQ